MATTGRKTPKVRQRLSRNKLTKAFVHGATIKNRATVNVPAGKRKTDREARIDIISNYFDTLDHKYYCPALKDFVGIYRITKRESKHQSSKSQRSTISLLNLEKVLNGSVVLKSTAAKSNGAQADFCKMFVLGCTIKGIGIVKTTVGKFKPDIHKSTKFALYCITHIRVQRIKTKAK